MNIFDAIQRVGTQVSDAEQVLSDWLGAGGIPVEPALAQRRADVCLKCPKHTQNWRPTESVAAAIKLQMELKNKLQMRVKGEKSLHTCSVCGCAMRLKVHVPIEHVALDPEERSEYWNECWLLKEE